MILTRLELNNFGPYFGRTSVDLSVSDRSPVILIHGENERGKTSFANALRWCLYEKARGREGRPVPTWKLINQEAIDDGRYNMSVRLEFSHEGEPFDLERTAQSTVRPTSDDMVKVHVSLKRAGNVLPTERVPIEIGDVLHEDIARFFFFDGEMLNEYEDLLSSADNGAKVVRESIERILGLPALFKAAEDVNALRLAVDRRLVKQAKNQRENERLTSDVEQKQDEMQSLDRDLEQNRALVRQYENTRDRLRDEQRQFMEVEAEIKQLDELDRDIADLEGQCQQVRGECCDLLRRHWWMPMEAAIHLQQEHVEKQLASALRSQSERVRFEAEVAQLRRALEVGKCGACGQAVVDAATIRARIAACEAGLRDLSACGPEEVEALMTRAGDLRPLAGVAQLPLFREKEVRLRSLSVRLRNLKRRESSIRERIGDHDRTEVKRSQREYDDCIAQLASVTMAVAKAEKTRVALKTALDGLRKEIKSLPGVSVDLAREASVYKGLEELFNRGIDDFRVLVRQQVEEEASRIHATLSTESDYAGIKLEDNYGLVLTNRQGRVIRRSAGSEQIVALSLIGALNKCATREGPIVMDTPFGRLDKGHRANILRFAPGFGPQVILLVQSGELDRKEDLKFLEGHVGREYRIERDGASDRSTIRAIGGPE